MRTPIGLRKAERRRSGLYSRSEAAVATIWLVFYVVALAVAGSSPVVSHALEVAAQLGTR
ncbi:MAG TPA: hypothetical protein VFB29_02470 [Pseudolabrys sp.]|nr:hypothetical protein [Pseudolabrys sp.]